MLVYDVSDALSFTKLESWRTAFLQAADVKDPQTFPFVVLGNKADLEAPKHIVQASQVAAWCEKHNKIPTFLVRTGWRAGCANPRQLLPGELKCNTETPRMGWLATRHRYVPLHVGFRGAEQPPRQAGFTLPVGRAGTFVLLR